MIYECTDCKHCISYSADFRIACGHPELEAREVYKYQPVGEQDAERCVWFEEGESEIEMSWEDIDTAVETYGDDVSSLRKFAEARRGAQ